MATIVRIITRGNSNNNNNASATDVEFFSGETTGFIKRIVLQAVCLSLCVWCVLWGLRLMRQQYVAPAMPGKLFKRHLWLQQYPHHPPPRGRHGGASYT
jgi:hypothetical protein